MSQPIPTRMKALLKKEEVKSFVLEEIDVHEPKDDEVLIKVEAVSICGSDINLYNWNDVAKVIATIPFIPGHEAAGTVVKCGPNSVVKVGQRVGVENHFYCGDCIQCNSNAMGICPNMGQYGHGKKTEHGGFCQYSIVRSKYCYPLTTDISAAEIAMLEPLGVAHNAIEKLEVEGEDVLIIGCGPVGLLGIGVARSLGAKRIYAADIDENRLNLALDFGANVKINTAKEDMKEKILKETQNVGIGRICEMSGAAVVANGMFKLLRKGGHVVMVGLLKTPFHIEDPLPDIIFKALTLNTIHGREIFHTWEECEKLIAEKKIDVNKVISHRFPMSQFEDAFSALFSGQACKIIIDPQQ